MVTSGSFSWCLWKVRNTVVLGGASLDSNVFIEVEVVLLSSEEGTSGFLSCSDVGLRLCMPFQT